LFEQRGQDAFIPLLCFEVASEKAVAIQFDPPVDKGRNSAEDDITAKTLAVEDGAS